MTPDHQEIRMENVDLRVALWQAARRLKDILDAPHRKVGDEKVSIIIPATLREKATEALEKAKEVLAVKEGPGR